MATNAAMVLAKDAGKKPRDKDAAPPPEIGAPMSLENAIVVDEFSILNPEGLRYPDEFVRHKALDALGDLALLGHPVIGQLKVCKSGHALHHKLVHRVLADATQYSVVRARRREVERLELRPPDFTLALESVGN